MEQIGISRARGQFSKLVRLAELGEEVLITRAGKPVARLTQIASEKRTIRFGLLKGNIHVSDDFDACLPEDLLIRPEE